MHTVIETSECIRQAKKLKLTDEEIDRIKAFVARNPNSGDVIPGTGGTRKVRIRLRGAGKSGGYRVITFFTGSNFPVFLLNVYSKHAKANLTQAEKNSIRLSVMTILENYRE